MFFGGVSGTVEDVVDVLSQFERKQIGGDEQERMGQKKTKIPQNPGRSIHLDTKRKKKSVLKADIHQKNPPILFPYAGKGK